MSLSKREMELLEGAIKDLDVAVAEFRSEIHEALEERREIGREIRGLGSRLTTATWGIGKQTLDLMHRPKFRHTVPGLNGKRKGSGTYS